MKRVVLAGGSGFLGTRLTEELLARNYEVIVLTRQPKRRADTVREIAWDGRSAGEWLGELNGARAVVNLAGRTVNCKHTPINQREILESRVNSVKALEAAIRQCKHPPQTWVQAGSLAIYGDAGDNWCDESTPSGQDFSVDVCRAWEQAFTGAAVDSVRRVILRIGLSLDRGRGALGTLERLVRWFLGGAAGRGRQYLSWIHWRDLNQMFLWAIERGEITGVYNATSPNPVNNAAFMRELRSVLRRPWCPPAPVWAVRVGSQLMGTEASLALTGRRCLPRRFLDQGFSFAFPNLEAALKEIYG
jgi:uncharacterized protein (TIGR01777 family)